MDMFSVIVLCTVDVADGPLCEFEPISWQHTGFTKGMSYDNIGIEDIFECSAEC